MSDIDEETAEDAPKKKRSWLKLAIIAAVPLVLAGGGFAAWTLYFAAPDGEAHAAGKADHGAPDPMKVSALPREIAAESSVTHTYALSVLIAGKCGASHVEALRAASNAEAEGDGLLAQLSWESAARRSAQLKERSCGHLLAEIDDADAKAAARAASAAKEAASGH
ncbi:MAG: hypothetical protein JJ913_10420 [Rhizobiaceae bacterium]|nr:hypothetical protein [Rhizobiaceae bacterium]